MKELLVKVVKSPAVRKAAVGLVLAIAAALGVGGLGGCGGALSVPPEAAQAVNAALCIRAALDGVDPEALSLNAARALAAQLKACEHGPSEAPDAGR
jgi:hypothetical protein